jgi:hypothetical protein
MPWDFIFKSMAAYVNDFNPVYPPPRLSSSETISLYLQTYPQFGMSGVGVIGSGVSATPAPRPLSPADVRSWENILPFMVAV